MTLLHEPGGGSREAGAPVPEGTGDERQRVSGAERVSSSALSGIDNSADERTGTRYCEAEGQDAKRTGRPKQFGGRLRVPMTDEQREAVDALAVAGGCSAAEAIRRLIDGAPVPQARSAVSMDPKQYRDMLEAVQVVRTDLNRGLGNWYRLVRDSYSGQVPSESEVGRVREGLENALSDLATLARAASGWSPW